MILIDLFVHFFMIGLFTFGGGYSSVPMIEQFAVEMRGYITHDELSSIFSISEITPGPFCINCATFVGSKTAGVAGAIAATFSFILPSIIIMLAIAYIYIKYKDGTAMKNIFKITNACIVASLSVTAINIIANAIFFNSKIGIAFTNVDIWGVLLFIAACIALKCFKISPIFVVLGTSILGAIVYR